MNYNMPKLLFQGHGSFRLTTNDGTVVYIDPYVGTGYDLPADMILITHQHDDHNKVDLITNKKHGCTIITNHEALEGGKHNSFNERGIEIDAVVASNVNHPPDQCVGFIMKVDGKTIYFSGDTSKTEQMSEFKSRNIDYAFFCTDGYYNMSMEEAAECANIIGAKHNTPVHMKPGELFDREMAERFEGPNRLIIAAGEELELT